MNLEKTIVALVKKFEDANWGEIKLTLKNSDHELTIIPSAIGNKITKQSDIDWIIVYAEHLLDLDCSSIEKLAQNLIDYDKKLLKSNNEKAKNTKMVQIEMAMPENCEICRFREKQTWSDHTCCVDPDHRTIKDIKIRPDWCQLIEVLPNVS